MMYAVNRATKEHIIIPRGSDGLPDYPISDWQIVYADDNGWVKWQGGIECPLPDNQEFEALEKDGVIFHGYEPQNKTWRHDGGEVFINSYRPVLSSSEKCRQCAGRGFTFFQTGEDLIRTTCPLCLGTGVSVDYFIKKLKDDIEMKIVNKHFVTDKNMSDPHNWRCGDVLECVDSNSNLFTVNKFYGVVHDSYGSESFIDDSGDFTSVLTSHTCGKFEFHSRPNPSPQSQP